MHWSELYENEDEIIRAYLGKGNPKEMLPLPKGYSPSVYSDLDAGKFNTNSNSPATNKRLSENLQLVKFKKKKLWELAATPGKNILINFGMNYMSPNDIQVIPIMMLFMLFVNTFKEMFEVNSRFAAVDSSIDAEVDTYDINIMKGIYVLSCVGNLMVGLWKLNKMGLIPNTTSDWLGWESKLLSAEKFI
ncbi:hypothetical protein CANINC_002373 [Pichia inconspicua]|uniref:ER membrane protein complex subunit 4 n=1 Tax=Pichia inconspicua TaxID=52247 RepID=A0A4V4NFQ5_9ASCO|nr:hypothetical protein CANINC_002373 [[Candida] inconspicua]